MKPNHTHDCTACTFLGHARGADVYACIRYGVDPEAVSLIIRYSSDGPDYASYQVHQVRRFMTTSRDWLYALGLYDGYQRYLNDALAKAGVELAAELLAGAYDTCTSCEGSGRVYNNADDTSGQWFHCEDCQAGRD